MPKRTDIKKILIIGSGPIIISQACEFDYSGVQACKALKEEGFEVVLINSNPATIMTDPEIADRTYIEPITPEMVCKIIERERPDAILPTLGGQTGLNCAVAVADTGILKRLGVEMIGASPEVIKKAEDRQLFRDAMANINLRVPTSVIVRSMAEVLEAPEVLSYPIIVRPSFTLGGTGGGIAYNLEDLKELSAYGLEASMIQEVMLEESVLGWKEFELEVMRDVKDNVVIICSIENLDPMGVHTGDSITVAPAQTLSDREYQRMRDASLAIIREIGVETGGSNIQFAVQPQTGEMVVIEMNPRVSRSSALASKATGFPIAKIAAKLAVGFTLDEIPNDITKETYASFEPSIDYCVVKIPRWTFEKFPGAEDLLTTSMKSVGEVMAIGRTFKEALQKGLRSLEISRFGLGADGKDIKEQPWEIMLDRLRTPNSQRLFYLRQAFRQGMSIPEVYELTKIDSWFLSQIRDMVQFSDELASYGILLQQGREGPHLAEMLRRAKEFGFSDVQLAHLWGLTEEKIRRLRLDYDIRPVYKLVDTCAAEFEAYTPYYYSTYEVEDESRRSERSKVVILGGGPNRIGQGIEFDYCCCHASFALKEMGIESIMVNSNPETVSTDYDTSDKLFFEPLTREDVLNIIASEKPLGLIVQFGGQTPLNLAVPLAQAGAKILGTSPDAIDRAEDRERFKRLLSGLKLRQPDNGTAASTAQALKIAKQIGYPVVVRPSYVLGGRAMQIVADDRVLANFMSWALEASPEHPILIDKFLEDAIEVDVDAIADGKTTIIGGIMEHIEEAGIHSGDSACVLPPYSLPPAILKEITRQTQALAAELGVVGLMNIQFAVKDGQVYILEVNPRASRTIPFVSKATGVPLAKLATKVMLGATLDELGFTRQAKPPYFAVKEAVFPFRRFPGVDPLLGPEMRSTGEVMGLDENFALSFAKSQIAAGQQLPLEGGVLFSVKNSDKPALLEIVRGFQKLGFELLATQGTADYLCQHGVKVAMVHKIRAGRPNIIDRIKSQDIALLINTPQGRYTTDDSFSIRRTALEYDIPYTTTIAAARATLEAIRAVKTGQLTVKSLQEYHTSLK
ncbi:carbamoyl-phosphate synthase large subunit [Desulfobacca acetoxidans]|uniref:Carbamoyl phosphate synthase large chain n=1 Tax=Desulfobacca acetoxidans (strain ATCC 700848 / DSM 11109 / ASRB2) TaxID=880072 RepID=F2NH72_DESAR|nr:carbamoyl-phosphate synthase large subunit [Desulfobacca acetoxidans]AEB08914.1 carbamoyl-phosphate synthase, large subunit [Desulfobacca acetoxidans DSM 11109]